MSLNEIWDSAGGSPFYPFVAKDSQFFVAFTLLLSSIVLAGFFGLNRSLLSLPLLGVPGSLAFGFGAVFMICAVGVYV
ncbi:cell cycle checkpoint protein [Blastomyces parvus]|uniref:Dolichyl-diphosphooligosaccharide-protein glycosyltransferase subunit OST5 n=1 Tax=Blastomyces parvus TaxID=2060905 RepID=A0A2B7WYZ5_9EURO|nr:cell cycle checkpoint protein [Blastomyces parvus]